MAGTGRRATPGQYGHHLTDGLGRSALSPGSVESLSLEAYDRTTPEIHRAVKKPFRRPDRGAIGKSRSYKADARDSNGNNSENIGFIPGTAGSSEHLDGCGGCVSRVCSMWQTLRAAVCCVVTCGVCRGDYVPCIESSESSTDGKHVENHGPRYTNPTCGIPLNPAPSQNKPNLGGSSFNYYDVKFRGQQIPWRVGSRSTDSCHKDATTCISGKSESPVSTLPSCDKLASDEFPSYFDEDLENNTLNVSMSSAELDDYINKKLLELFSMHQINMLAQCTSDTTFISKSSEITELIDSITKDYKIDEKVAECRIVTGIVRISTRKAKKKPKVLEPEVIEVKAAPTTPDLKTQISEFHNSTDDLTLKISVEDSLDVIVRNMPQTLRGTIQNYICKAPFMSQGTEQSGIRN
uniref:Keratinocyte differentiation factor 1 n=1 Tax=Callorhinchus milii TaxID=7868 RepID=A0A4W3KFU2_CALMI